MKSLTSFLGTHASLRDEKGLVGIGTIIVFIAMVLVAAVAAGILIRTSVALQEQADATAEETIYQVAAGVKVMSIIGRTGENKNIESIELVVKPRAGSPEIKLMEMVVEYMSDRMERHLKLGRWEKDNASFFMSFENREDLENHWDDLDGDEFAVVQVLDVSGTPPCLLSSAGDLVEIWIDVGKVEDNATVLAQEKLSIKLVPKVGFETYVKAIVPQTLVGKRVVEL